MSPEQLLFWESMAEHYLCTLGEVMIAALPTQLVLTSETRLMATGSDARVPHGPSAVLLEALHHREVLTVAEAGELLGLKDPMPVLKDMIAEGTIAMEEEMVPRYTPRMVKYVELTPDNRTEEALHAQFDRLARAGKQLDLLMRHVELSRCLSDDVRDVERSMLLRLSGASPGILKQLEKKGVLQVVERPADLPSKAMLDRPEVTLSPAQQQALYLVQQQWKERDVVLLRGVTSSGKTELYVQLMLEAMDRGEQVLYLLPEIALTTQVIVRLRARFGDRVAVHHSRLSLRERTELWIGMRERPEAYPLVVGARSALFLPFQHLSRIIVDEEHDASYKQQDPAPRYHARDMAIVLGTIHKARVLLGSATPSMESLYNAGQGKYGSAELLERFGDVPLPEVRIADLRVARRKRTLTGHFTQELIDLIARALARREQAIIFQNRRGYVPVWQCNTCGWVPECDHCDVSLTYHKQRHALHCHYCGRNYDPPIECKECHGDRLRMIGLGTERVEEELKELFPDARVARMDQDTTRGKKAFERILGRFGAGEVDILVGTQMVTKGLDFDQVTVVGILQADNLLRFPDMRAHERGFQMMAQVAGRSGRRKESGTVVLQAMDAHHPVIAFVLQHDVMGMYARELEHRKAHGYPPFTRLVEFTMKHKEEQRVDQVARTTANALHDVLGDLVLGPEAPPVAWVRDLHIRKVLVKLRKSRYAADKERMKDVIDRIFASDEAKGVQLIIDVDPV